MTKNIFKDRVSWINTQKELLELERQAEVENSKTQVDEVSLKTLVAKGIALCHLTLQERSTGLFGRSILTLTPKPKPGVPSTLPSHSFSSGDNVGIWENTSTTSASDQITSGVIAKVTSTSIQLALDEDSSEIDSLLDNSIFRIHRLANDVTYRRIKKGLETLEKLVSGQSSHITSLIFKETELREPLPNIPPKLLNSEGELGLFNRNLDRSQIEAIGFALKQKDLAVIHGPPGTGKTTTLVEAILQHVKLGNKVIAVAPSNLAVDNLLERLVDAGANVVRVGHPARATAKAQLRTLDALVQNSDNFELVKDIQKDIKTNLTTLSKTRDKGKRKRIKEDIKSYRKELRQRESNTSKEILSLCSVVLTTLTSAGNDGPLKLLSEDHFDLTVIDECSQGMESACYLSVMRSSKLILAGDHQQLPPTILSSEAASKGLDKSLMERIIDTYGDRVTRMLKVQYRMHESIMDWASLALYDKQLVAHHSVASHLLKDFENVISNEDTESSLILIDTAGCGFEELSGEDLSKGNEGEAGVVAAHVKSLVSSGVQEKDIAVISPYNLQVEMIRDLLRSFHPKVEVRSVDGFQGREKEAVVISLVRSNKQGEIGFLREDRRLNVAVTRARRHLALICDTDTVCRHQFINTLVEHIHSHGLVKSAHEFVNEIELYSSGNSYQDFISDPINKNQEKKLKNKEIKANKDELIRLDRERRRADMEKLILDFINSKKLNLKFPPELNSFDRMLVHEIAEIHNLEHQSFGEGKERYLTVKKKSDAYDISSIQVDNSIPSENGSSVCSTLPSVNLITDMNVLNCNACSKSDEDPIHSPLEHPKSVVQKESVNSSQTKSSVINKSNKENVKHMKKAKAELLKESDPVCKTCHICRKEVIIRNFDLHSIQCEKIKRDRDIKKEIELRKTEIRGAKKKEKKKQEDASEIDDFELMNRFQKENNTCAFPHCKNKCIILLQLCNFCKNNFCLTHHQAEIHGCGDEVRKHARTVLIKSVQNGVLTPGSRVPSKKPDPVVRAHLQRKLDKKLDKLEDERKIKKKNSK